MKVGIVTIFDRIPNYGNKLQNYAAIKIGEKYNFEISTLVTEIQNSYLYTMLKIFFSFITGYKIDMQFIRYKTYKFHKFNKKYLKSSNILLKGKDPSDKFDYFIVGSDQVWNTAWWNDLKKEAFLLTFARPEQKVCIAPSFGVSELPEEWKSHFKKWLPTFPMLSVREEAGAKIIKELTGQDAEVVIDPTLMLDADEWRKIEKKHKIRKKDNNKYIFKYFLGGEETKNKEYIDCIAKENHFEIIDIMDNNSCVFASGPSEFLDFIDNAELVCTDSFHATVFSILFGKPFLIMNRKVTDSAPQMSSRIETLLKKLNLEERLQGNVTKEDIFNCNYEKAYIELENERKKAYDFLERSLGL